MGQLRYLTGALEPGSKPHVLSLDAGFGYVSIANLGLLQLDVTVSGQSVHSALAHLGRNAVEDAAQLMQPLLELRQQVMLRKSSVPLHPETGLQFMEPRLNINRISGGIARNVVPDRCSFTIDRRLIPEETVESAHDEIVNALGRCDGVRWSITREFSIPSVPPSRDAQVRVLADAIANVTGTTGVYGDMLSGELPAAARHFWGAEAFATGVIRPGNRVHGVDEFVRERDLDQLAEVLARFLTGDRKEAA
jgi:acetylornithine deacetylase/succinyl-diaminopimelate desuccinylase-like protein